MTVNRAVPVALVFSLWLSAFSLAKALDVHIYKEYYSGMPYSAVTKQTGVEETTDIPGVSLKRRAERFAEEEWTQYFAFENAMLTDVVLCAEYDAGRCENAYVALLMTGYLPIFIKDDIAVINLIPLWSPDGLEVAEAAAQFDAATTTKAELVFLDVDSFMKVARGVATDRAETLVSTHLPEHAKGVFFTIDRKNNSVVMNFFAPKKHLPKIGIAGEIAETAPLAQ